MVEEKIHCLGFIFSKDRLGLITAGKTERDGQ